MDHLLGLVNALGREFQVDFNVVSGGIDQAPIAGILDDAALLELNGSAIGVIGGLRELEPFVPRLEEKAFVFEIDVSALHRVLHGRPLPRYRPLPRFPAATRDLAFVVDRSLAVGDLLGAAREAGGLMVEEIRLFDIFPLKEPMGKVSIALAVTLRAPDRTLADEEIAAAIERIVAAAKKNCDAELRRS
jgi:phenylalanyl-tRNA synthetase beta chain